MGCLPWWALIKRLWFTLLWSQTGLCFLPALLACRKCSGRITLGSEHETKNQVNWLPLGISCKLPVWQGEQKSPCFVVRERQNSPWHRPGLWEVPKQSQIRPWLQELPKQSCILHSYSCAASFCPAEGMQSCSIKAGPAYNPAAHTETAGNLVALTVSLVISISTAASRFCVYLSWSPSVHAETLMPGGGVK